MGAWAPSKKKKKKKKGMLRAPRADFEQARAMVAKLAAGHGGVGVLLAGCPVYEAELPEQFVDGSSVLTTRLDDVFGEVRLPCCQLLCARFREDKSARR